MRYAKYILVPAAASLTLTCAVAGTEEWIRLIGYIGGLGLGAYMMAMEDDYD